MNPHKDQDVLKRKALLFALAPRRGVRLGAWLCVALLAYLSLIPGNLQIRTGLLSQLEHVVAYLGTAMMLASGYPRNPRLIMLGLVAYGSLLEILQVLSPGRAASILDAAAIWSGAILGVVAVALLGQWLTKGSKD